MKTYSQQDYFVYIQSDEHQPFYVLLNSKVYSSSESGYLIIPKLADSSYQIVIGFAKNIAPEQRFPVTINKKDQGFQLKNFDGKGWGLFNLQTMSVIMNIAPAQKQVSGLTGVKRTDAFSALLANVVNDSAILYTADKPSSSASEKIAIAPELKQEPVIKNDTQSVAVVNQETEPVNTEQKADSSIITDTARIVVADNNKLPAQLPIDELKNATGDQNQKTSPDIASAEKLEKPFILKLGESTTEDAYHAVYLELYNLRTDTIRISIPFNDKDLVSSKAVKEDTLASQKQAREDTVALTGIEKKDTKLVKKTAVVIVNSDCKNFATENDVDKLRVRLINDKAIDEKIVTAKKFFRNRCLTVKQVTALSELFPTDETKYLFFETSYPFVSDSGNIYLLQELLESSLYKKRFAEMTKR